LRRTRRCNLHRNQRAAARTCTLGSPILFQITPESVQNYSASAAELALTQKSLLNCDADAVPD
jgi:hypothetical protein